MTSTHFDADRTVLRLAVAAALVVLLAAPAPVAAQGGGADDLQARAESHFNRGREYLELGEFSKAVAEYQKAYELVPHPEILYHLGQAHRLSGDRQTALDHYRKYLAIEPRGRAAEKTRRYIELLERALAEEEAAAAAARADGPAGKTAGGSGAGGGAESSPAADAGVDEVEQAHGSDELYRPDFAVPERDRGEPSPGRTLRIAGLAATGAGAIGLGIGIVFGLNARSLSSELSEERAAWTDEDIAKFSRGRRSERAAIFSAVGGALLVGGGVALYLVGRDRGSSESAPGATLSLAPEVTASRIGIGLSGRF